MSMATRRRRRGFTLIELTVGLSVTLLVTSAVMEAYVLVRKQMVRTRTELELARNARNVLSFMSRYLKIAGAGLPPSSSTNVDPGPYTNGGIPCRTNAACSAANTGIGGPVIVGTATGFGTVGDYPRPDTNLNGLSFQAQAEGNQRYNSSASCPQARRAQLDLGDYTNHATILNELSGLCLAGSGCSTVASSILLPGVGADCSGGGTAQPTCPWSLKKYRPGEYILVVFPNRQWVVRKINRSAFGAPGTGDSDPTLHSHCPAPGYPGISLFYEDWGGNPGIQEGQMNPAVQMGWQTEGESHPSLVLPYNRGWITTPERVFFRYQAATKTVQWQMCWGPFAPLDAKWRSIADATPCAVTAGMNGDTSDQKGGTGWITIGRNVETMTVSYFDVSDNAMAAPGTTVASLTSVGRVKIELLMRRLVAGTTLSTRESISIQLRARRF